MPPAETAKTGSNRALVVGAGISGLTIAHGLAVHGWQVEVIEAAHGPRGGGYMIDFFGPGYDTAEQMGVLDALAAHGKVFRELRYFDSRMRTTARADVSTIVAGAGGRYFSILRPDVERVLLDALPDAVSVHYGRRLAGIEQDDTHAHVTTDSTSGEATDDGASTGNDTFVADLVVGCDGIHSRTRGLLWGEEEQFVRRLGFRSAAYLFTDPELADKLGDVGMLSDSIDRQVGLYALDRSTAATLLIERTDDITRVPDPVAYWAERMSGLGSAVDSALAAADPQMYCDTVAQSIVPNWRRGRVVLAGDAAHAVSLLAGQGVSMALTGGWALSRALATCAQVDPTAAALGAAISNYESIFRPFVERRQRSGRRAAGTFCPRNTAELLVRRAAVNATRLPAVGRIVGHLVGRRRAVVG